MYQLQLATTTNNRDFCAKQISASSVNTVGDGTGNTGDGQGRVQGTKPKAKRDQASSLFEQKILVKNFTVEKF